MVMERICVSVLYFILLFDSTSCFPVHNGTSGSIHRYVQRRVCRFCDVRSSNCTSSGICNSLCNKSAICEYGDEICASAWRRNRGNVTLETVCHPKSQPFHGVLLNDYNNTKCLMKQQKNDFYICSCSEEECNDELIFTSYSTEMTLDIDMRLMMILILVLVAVLVVLSSSFLYFCSNITLSFSKRKPRINDKCAILLDTQQCSESVSSNNKELLPIQLDRIVGKGRFAEVHCAHFGNKCENGSYQLVAVKIFPLDEFLSWKSERDIFLSAELRHENILQFLAAEEHLEKHQYWLIMAYHSQGNLCDYLRAYHVEWMELCTMVGDIVRGVAYLHGDRTETGEIKTPVAHRDLKSDNVLLKDDMSCCICDFGLSIQLENDMSTEELANHGQVGTARYMAPEILESRINLENTVSFKQADVYAMALVLWEITSRCTATGEMREYEPPFGKLVQPCIESMKDIVIRDNQRPEISSSWSIHPGLAVVCEAIVECWDEDPEARLTAHCVDERFKEISNPSFLGDLELKINNVLSDK